MADHWSETGAWISPAGDRVQGRAAIQAQMEELFGQEAGGKIELEEFSVRLVSADVAVEEGVARVTKPGEAASVSSYLAIHVKKERPVEAGQRAGNRGPGSHRGQR